MNNVLSSWQHVNFRSRVLAFMSISAPLCYGFVVNGAKNQTVRKIVAEVEPRVEIEYITTIKQKKKNKNNYAVAIKSLEIWYRSPPFGTEFARVFVSAPIQWYPSEWYIPYNWIFLLICSPPCVCATLVSPLVPLNDRLDPRVAYKSRLSIIIYVLIFVLLKWVSTALKVEQFCENLHCKCPSDVNWTFFFCASESSIFFFICCIRIGLRMKAPKFILTG